MMTTLIKFFGFLLLLHLGVLVFCEDWEFKFKNEDRIKTSSFSLAENGFLSFPDTAFESNEIKRPFKDLNFCRRNLSKRDSGEYLIKLSDLSLIRCRIDNIKDGIVNVRSDAIGSVAIPISNISEFTVLDDNISPGNSGICANWRNLSDWKFLPEKFAKNFVIVEDKILLKGPLLACIRYPYSKLRISFSSLADFDHGLGLIFFANIAKENTEAYKFYLYPHSVNLIRKKNEEHKDLGAYNFNDSAWLSPILKVDLFADRDKGIFFIVLNDGKTYKFIDKEAGKILGDYIIFTCPANFVVISDLNISEWDGSAPKSDGNINAISDNIPSQDEDMILLRNNDSMRGELALISGKNIKFNTSFGSLDIPSERVAKIAIKNAGKKIEDDNTKDEATSNSFSDISYGGNSFLKAQIIRIDDKTIALKHKILGALNLAKDFVREIRTIDDNSGQNKSNSLFDEIFQSASSPDRLEGPDEMENIQEELGELLELCY